MGYSIFIKFAKLETCPTVTFILTNIYQNIYFEEIIHTKILIYKDKIKTIITSLFNSIGSYFANQNPDCYTS